MGCLFAYVAICSQNATKEGTGEEGDTIVHRAMTRLYTMKPSDDGGPGARAKVLLQRDRGRAAVCMLKHSMVALPCAVLHVHISGVGSCAAKWNESGVGEVHVNTVSVGSKTIGRMVRCLCLCASVACPASCEREGVALG